jgi:hypothetical protein
MRYSFSIVYSVYKVVKIFSLKSYSVLFVNSITLVTLNMFNQHESFHASKVYEKFRKGLIENR